MEWTINYLEEQGIVHAKISGPMTWDENKQMCEEVHRCARNNNTNKYLADCREIETTLSILQMDKLPKIFREIGATGDDSIAILYNPSQGRAYKFFQSVSKIANFNLRLFTDEDEAMEWLRLRKFQPFKL